MNLSQRIIATKRLIKSPWFAVLLTLLLITSTISLITPYPPYATAQEACVRDSSCTTKETSNESEELTDNTESLENTDTTVPSEKKSLIASFIETVESILSVAHKAKDNDKGTFIVLKQNAVFEEDGSVISIPELAEKDFTFDWMCTLPTNAQTESGSFTLRDTQIFTSKKFPAGTQCTITEDLQSAQVPGYSHEVFISTKKPAVTPNAAVQLSIEANKEVSAHVYNKYTKEAVKPAPKTGSFVLEKKVTGTQTDKEFEFTWLCRNEDNSIVRNTAKLKNGQKILVDNLPLESTCQIAEKTASIPGYKHSLTWFTNEEKTHAENILSIHPRRQDQRELVITAENTYTPIAQESATFKVSKKVIVHGDKDDNGPINPYEKEFRFRWECIKPNNKKETGNFQTINGASSAPRGSFPIGTQCSITEDAETAHQNGFVHKLTFEASNNIGDFEQISADTAKITLKENGGFELVARNEYTPIVAPVPPTTTSSTAPTTSSSSTPVTTTSSSTPKTTSSSATPTTTISSSTPATTSSSSQAFPPIIPIPIPIPFPPKPAPTVNPPAANTTPTTSSVSASSSVTPSASADSHSGNNNGGMLARTGASVIWMILAALLFASVGTIIICRTRLKKES